jgi:transcriptional regulator with XRE-family HTH domain
LGFTQRLKDLRRQRGLTQRQLAAIFGFASSTISMYESGRRTPDLDTLSRLADFFAVSIDFLVRDNPALEPLPTDLQAFVTRESNLPYLVLAKELAEQDLDPGEVRELSRVLTRLTRR